MRLRVVVFVASLTACAAKGGGAMTDRDLEDLRASLTTALRADPALAALVVRTERAPVWFDEDKHGRIGGWLVERRVDEIFLRHRTPDRGSPSYVATVAQKDGHFVVTAVREEHLHAGAPTSAPASIGVATMQPDRTLVLDLRADGAGGTIGDARVVYAPSHKDYASVLAHIGGLEPGQTKPVPLWPSTDANQRVE